MLEPNELLILSCGAGKKFTNRILKEFSKQEMGLVKARLIDSEEIIFSNGEIKTVLHESVRRKEIFIIQMMKDPQSHYSVNDNLLALFSAIDAVRLSDAADINVILPQFPYSRQERRKTREGVTAKLCAKFLEETGAKRIFSFDIHSEAIAGFFDKASLSNIRASSRIIEEIKSYFYQDNDFVVVSPDTGGVELNNYYAKKFGTSLAMIHKSRNYSKANTVDSMRLIGEVQNRNILMIDDIIDSGGTIVKACENLKNEGAKDIILACTFPFFTGNAIENLTKAYEAGLFKKLIGTDAVIWGEEFEKHHPWYHEVSVASLCLRVMLKVFSKESITFPND
jgi:ribose-phosphate pyrophosphokinase